MTAITAKHRPTYDVRWVPTWGPIGLLRVRRLKRNGWEHAGALQTGLLRRDHCLLKTTGGAQ